MQINWCLKGIASQTGFGDTEALAVLSETGICSRFLAGKGPSDSATNYNQDSQSVLSLAALDDHVNHYASAGASSPYVSLSAGCFEYAGRTSGGALRAAAVTAMRFATRNGKVPGYVFRCWVVTAPQIAAELPGLADEVRDLNLFQGFHAFHYQGEIAAKLVVPRRQVQSVVKLAATTDPIPWSDGHVGVIANADFIPPERISNIIAAL